jgi:hypothetical protein
MSPLSDSEVLTANRDATSQTHLTGDRLSMMDDVKWKWGEFPESASAQLYEAPSTDKQPAVTVHDRSQKDDNIGSIMNDKDNAAESLTTTLDAVTEPPPHTADGDLPHVVEPPLSHPAPEMKKGRNILLACYY